MDNDASWVSMFLNSRFKEILTELFLEYFLLIALNQVQSPSVASSIGVLQQQFELKFVPFKQNDKWNTREH